MGIIQTEITLTNALDEGFAREGYIKPEDIRTVTVQAVVDTGSMHLVITEDLRQKLGLAVRGEKTARIANGQRLRCKVTDGVKFRWKNREMILEALVIPGAETVLMGALTLEGLDLMVNPVSQELVGIHGDEVEYLVL